MNPEWMRTGDPLGDFLRLIFLLEEALEKLGAPRNGTLGEKLKATEGFFQALDPGLMESLWELLWVRNRVVHERQPVPKEAMEVGSATVARVLVFLEKQGYYRSRELDERLAILRSWPQALEPKPVAIPAVEPQAPPPREEIRPREDPRRHLPGRPLELVFRGAWWRGWRRR